MAHFQCYKASKCFMKTTIEVKSSLLRRSNEMYY